ncbi:MAG TPA: cysteine--tRNA ligase [Acidimicrobiales bacterium]|nr:cysteine--tRNA ligase [Acidimicrobiales bacterium]
MRLWDTAFREVVDVKTRQEGRISLYVCGPTPYADPHAGHGRLLLVYDVLRRYLEWRGWDVRHVSNITDIEDKIIARAAAEGIAPEELVARGEAQWFAASDQLGVLRPHAAPRATEYVDKIVDFIAGLIESGHAYETSDGVYFEVSQLADYGALLNQSLDSLRAGARVEVIEDKRAPGDFALWKLAKPGEPEWPSPWGAGRPGWHIECTVMALDLLGEDFDLHGAGTDLIFPHNENERAQSVAAGRRFARHWLHNEMLTTGGEKMSKSLGNVLPLQEVLADRDPRALRLLVLRSHYRTQMEVTPDGLDDATAALRRLDAFARRFPPGGETATGAELDQFISHMEDDLDTPGATAVIFDTLRRANAEADRGKESFAQGLAAEVHDMCAAVGLVYRTGVEIDDESQALVAQRDAARAAKDFARADELRGELEARGWQIEDTPEGTKLHPA